MYIYIYVRISIYTSHSKCIQDLKGGDDLAYLSYKEIGSKSSTSKIRTISRYGLGWFIILMAGARFHLP